MAEARASAPARTGGWRELYQREDWWAIWVGLGLVVVALLLFSASSPILKTLSVNPGGTKWSNFGDLGAHFAANGGAYVVQFVVFAAIFGLSAWAMGIAPARFLPAFLALYVLSLAMFAISGWANAAKFNLEAPLVALVFGVVVANLVPPMRWMDPALRVEYYIKVGIVLLGASFPVSLIASAGPIAIFQATAVAVTTCLVIYFVATRVFGLDRRLAAVIGVGGSVCGVSASMAIAAAVNARKEHLYTSVTLVVAWALAMILILPFAAAALGLTAGVGGAWIGTSEFADAAGIAAASAYGKMAGAEDSAIKAFTLMKVIGRDMWIGVWSIVWALIASFVWEQPSAGRGVDIGEVWRRFPKFVIGFFAASILMSLATGGYSAADVGAIVRPKLLLPLAGIRTWAFIFCFLSIGLSTRFRDLEPIGWRAFSAFTIGVAVNVALGLWLSASVFAAHWSAL